MPSYDIIFIHPPAHYDFRRKPLFTGALGRSVETVQFSKVPIGMLSLAEYQDRHGYKVMIDNLGDRMVTVPGFDVEQHIKNWSAQIFAIGLHFQQHSQGAIEIARLCKKFHPNSLVMLGGLTATCFHEEIIEKFECVDIIIRGEAEKPLLQFLRAYEKEGKVTSAPNLTYRDDNGEIHVTPMMEASQDLDDFEFTRFDLIEPKTSIYPPDSVHRYSLEVCRGCIYNCTICGGSAYTYKKYLGMSKPAFRSPAKIVADMKKLNNQGIKFIGLFQDMRMAGKKYWQELVATLIKEKPEIERLSLDLLAPADEEFIRAIAGIGRQVIFHLCPDTGSDSVRRLLGKHYSNEALLETMRICYKYQIPVTNFFSVGLAGETDEQMHETWDLWAKLDHMDHEAHLKGHFGDIDKSVPIGGQILGPIVLDPGSQAFDAPEKFGFKLLYKNFEEYHQALSQPSWHQWINYETRERDKDAILEMIFQSTEFTIDQREKYGFFGPQEAHYERCKVEADRVIVKELENIMKLENQKEKEFRIVSIRKNLDELEKRRMVFLD
ncbi:radical SAM protein [bacterium]|nr:radical SAM protein [bacterium]